MMLTILVVDDDAMVRTVVRQILEDAGYTVIEAADGASGLERFARQQPDGVVTDIIMPRKSGIELIGALRAAGEQVAIVAMSGGGRVVNTDVLAEARVEGADSTLDKPFEPRALIDALEQALAVRR